MPRLPIAIEQIDATSRYTQLVLSHVPTDQWVNIPIGGSSHVAWQVGHIAWAKAAHALRTVCGVPMTEVVPEAYGKLFGKGSEPVADAGRYPTPVELLNLLQCVHDRVMSELPRLPESVMDEPASHATGLIHDKFGLLMWIARHEMLHVGQIGMIRRGLGMSPYR